MEDLHPRNLKQMSKDNLQLWLVTASSRAFLFCVLFQNR